jgi:hypothetical protein
MVRTMLDRTDVLVAVAIATLVAPAIFLAALAIAGVRRSRGQPVGEPFVAWVTLIGGSSLGLMVLMADDLVISWPVLGAIVVLAALLLRRGRVRLCAWFVAGAAAPWAIVGGISVASLVLGIDHPDPIEAWLGFTVGVVPLLAALVLATARRVPDRVPAHGPGGRSFGDLAAAVRAPALVGPFGLSEVALLATTVATWLVVGLVLPATLPDPVRLAVLVALAAILAAEAYIRAMPAPTREAFEAFSWLGEWELAQVRALTGEGVPTSPIAARRWLRVHPEASETRWLRVEMLTFARQYDQAKAVAERMSDATPAERFDRAVAKDFADWFSGGDGDLASIEAAAENLLPPDGDERLRAEVIIAIANVRRRMAAGDDPIEAGAPLREVRKRLGKRADGQVGRALRVRLIRPLLIVGALVSIVSLLLPDLAPIL